MVLDPTRWTRNHARYRPFFNRRTALLLGVALVLLSVFFLYSRPSYEWPVLLQYLDSDPERMPPVAEETPLFARVPCFGPRNKLLSASPDDDLHTVYLETPYPRPFAGSYEDLGLKTSWSTVDGRYGPYGYGEEKPGYKRLKVDWSSVNWGRLQNQCFAHNKHRFPPTAAGADDMSRDVRMAYRQRTQEPKVQRWNEFKSTQRTAIVLRTYSGYEYKQEDMLYIRSLLVEAGLKTGGEYKVILLVDVKNAEEGIFESRAAYDKALVDANIPAELHSIAVLWEERLLQSWYPMIEEYQTMYQVYQPMQLFALHYPEFDHYWQLELDMRFLGDVGQYLDALAEFARQEPRKQALERSTFQLMQDEIGSYKDLRQAVNVAAQGGSYAWGPVRITDVKPIGPEPPTRDPVDDNFEWGVGEEADAIVTSFCMNVTNSYHWQFKDWIYGFAAGRDTPRFFCPPAITRTSRALLLAVHEAQLAKGLRVPSEATPVSFALWNGLKISYPPQPLFWKTEDDAETRKGWWKGGPANSTAAVMGNQDATHPTGEGLSFWWGSGWPREIMNAWQTDKETGEQWPWLLTRYKGEVYAPNMLLHPVKH